MKLRAEMIALSTLALIATAGCTKEARQDLGQAGSNIEQATEKSVQGTAEAADKAGDKIAQETNEAVQDTKVAADAAGDKIAQETKEAGQAIDRGLDKTGAAIQKGASNAAEAVGGVVNTAGKEVRDAAQVTALTPKIKNALVSSSIDASTIDVDTSGEKDTVYLKGTVPSAALKQKAEQIARKELQDAKSKFKLVNQLQVSGGAKSN